MCCALNTAQGLEADLFLWGLNQIRKHENNTEDFRLADRVAFTDAFYLLHLYEEWHLLA